ncbi:hypothetical protein [Cohnella lupini]|uniref:Uncharacterized protein n=1 Tax=Cohnella lupini TaxID=1294267 RepID=A0A3D9I5Y8_9BACL|nr:hypothetical protein [Cohnella lupini]RED57172.1 hypothetical protein DFP95_11186 [Cohnella lupini]
MIKFELKEAYEKQDARFAEIKARYQQAVIDAGTRLADLKSEQEELLRQEFSTGADLSKEKAGVRVKIEEAERQLTAAETESRKANDYARDSAAEGRITVRNLVIEWNGKHRNKIRDIELDPIIERMSGARNAYLNAVLDYYEFDRMYSPVWVEMCDLERIDIRPGDGLAVHKIATPADLPQITDDDLSYIEHYHKLPEGVERSTVTPTGGKR